MTEPRDEDLAAAATADDDAEVVDAEPVGASAAPLPAPASVRTALIPSSPVAVQAAAVAVTGFAAGAATVAVVRRHRARKALKQGRRAIKRGALGEVLGTRSFLVDIHLLGGRE